MTYFIIYYIEYRYVFILDGFKKKINDYILLRYIQVELLLLLTIEWATQKDKTIFSLIV